MNWIPLTSDEQLQLIDEQSRIQPVVIFKHSTRCSISSMAKSRLERSTPPATVLFYYLDVIAYRPLSNLIAERYRETHESPQVLLISDGTCVYEESHNGIDMQEIAEACITHFPLIA